MKRNLLPFFVAALLWAQSASASDTVGTLLFIPFVGSVLGLLVGIGLRHYLTISGRARHSTWRMLLLGVLCGGVAGVGWLMHISHSNTPRIVASFGRYDYHRGGMGAMEVPDGFTVNELRRFYMAVNDPKNPVLCRYSFDVGLVRESIGGRRVYLNVYPSIVGTPVYDEIDHEVRSQMKRVLEQTGMARDDNR